MEQGSHDLPATSRVQRNGRKLAVAALLAGLVVTMVGESSAAATPRPGEAGMHIAREQPLPTMSSHCLVLPPALARVRPLGSVVASQSSTVPMAITALDDRGREELLALDATLASLGVERFLVARHGLRQRHGGCYSPFSNNLFISDRVALHPTQLLTVLRHEGWHSVQDCRGGGLDSRRSRPAMDPTELSPLVLEALDPRRFPDKAIWLLEVEAHSAAMEPGRTLQALGSCSTNGKMGNPADGRQVVPPL